MPLDGNTLCDYELFERYAAFDEAAAAGRLNTETHIIEVRHIVRIGRDRYSRTGILGEFAIDVIEVEPQS